MTADEVVRLSVPDEHLHAAIYLLRPMQLTGLHVEAWKVLTAEAARRRAWPPSEVCLERRFLDALPVAVRGLLGYEAW